MKKGFTLVELLATIVVLSILALITVSLISGYIDTSRKAAFQITCDEIFDSANAYMSGEGRSDYSSCTVFDFGKNVDEPVNINGYRYEPISILSLKGDIPKSGTLTICGTTKNLIIDNGVYTCVRNSSDNKVLDGNVIENDITAPEILSVTASSLRTDYVMFIVNAIEIDGEITNYYYNLKNDTLGVNINKTKDASDPNSNIMSFSGLNSNTEYIFSVTVENKNNLKTSREYVIKTKELSASKIVIDKTPKNTEYYTSQTVKITFDDKENIQKYFKSTVSATVNSGVIVSSCGTGSKPGECVENNDTTLSPNTWYLTNNTYIAITYTQNGVLRTHITDGLNFMESGTTIDKIDTSKPSSELKIKTLKTSVAIVEAKCTDGESGIKSYEFSKDGGNSWTNKGVNNVYTFKNLSNKNNKEYDFYVRCTNGSGLVNTANAKTRLVGQTNPKIKQLSQEPQSSTYASERVFEVTYASENIDIPEYYIETSVPTTITSGTVDAICTKIGTCSSVNTTSLKEKTLYRIKSTSINVKFTNNGVLYAKTSDGTNIFGSTYTVERVDSTPPSASLSISNVKSDRFTVVAACSDDLSGITKYEYSSDNGLKWVDGNLSSTYTFTGLSTNTTYNVKMRCTNGSGLKTEKSTSTVTKEITRPSILLIEKTPASGYSYSTSKTYKITYSGVNILSPKFYLKSTVSTTVTSGQVIAKCSSTTYPTSCVNSNSNSIEANKWYQISGSTVNVTFTQEGTLYALTSDETNYVSGLTMNADRISTGSPTAPTITGGSSDWTNGSRTISVSGSSTEKSGINRYQYYISTRSDYLTGGSWNNCSNGTSQTITTNGERYIFFRAVANNGNISGNSNYQVTKIDTGYPSTPAITGGSTDYTSIGRTISVSQGSSATSGINRYQYYISTRGDYLTGGSWNNCSNGTSQFINVEGTRYIFFRAVSNSGNVSGNSNYQITNVDLHNPTINASVSGRVITVRVRDNIGTIGYGVNQSTSSQPSYSYYTPTNDKTITYEASRPGDYVVWTIDGSQRYAYASYSIPSSAFNYNATLVQYGAMLNSYQATGYCSIGKYTNGSCYIESNESICGADTKPIYKWDSCSYRTNTCKETCTNNCYKEKHCDCMHGNGEGVGHCTYDAENGLPIYRWFDEDVCNTSCNPCGSGSPNECVGENKEVGKEVIPKSCYNPKYVYYVCGQGASLNGKTCLYYSCPNGGSLSGSTCSYYACPEGGTLNGTICYR